MTTRTDSTPVEDYLARVRVALSDLPAAERDDLIEDLELHLGEVAAEGDGSLEDRLGPPDEYAAELRASAGLPEPGQTRAGHDPFGHAKQAWRDAMAHDRAVRGRAFLATLRPGWWVLRGYLIVAAPSLVRGDIPSSLPVPNVGGPWIGAVLVAAAIAASVWVGLHSRERTLERGLWTLVNVGLVVISVAAAVHVRDNIRNNLISSQGVPYAEPYGSSEYQPYLEGPNGRITNIYPFDSQGHLLSGIRLYDESGNPINLPTQPNIYGQPLKNSFGTTTKGTKIRNAYPVRQFTLPGRAVVTPPTVKVLKAKAVRVTKAGRTATGKVVATAKGKVVATAKGKVVATAKGKVVATAKGKHAHAATLSKAHRH